MGASTVTTNREIAFNINDVARLLRTYADQKAASFGLTRAKWAVLVRLDRFEGLKQNELADMLDLQPISLTRLLDGLSENGLLERLSELGEDLMTTALAGLDQSEMSGLLTSLTAIKENLRQAVQKKSVKMDQR